MATNEAPPATGEVNNQPTPPTISTDREDVTLDSILKHIGQFGRFQLIVFMLICLPMMFHAMFSVTYVFTAGTVVHRCNITECDDTPWSPYDAAHTEFSIPRNGKDLDKCNRYTNNELAQWNQTNDICLAQYYTQQIETCPDQNFIFRDNEVTISNDVSIKVHVVSLHPYQTMTDMDFDNKSDDFKHMLLSGPPSEKLCEYMCA